MKCTANRQHHPNAGGTSIKRIALAGLLALTLAGLTAPQASAAELALSNLPLYLELAVDPNILFNMSVETPMGGAAYNDQPGTPAACKGRQDVSGSSNIGTCYFDNVEYIGYFDPWKCYDYNSSLARFEPAQKTNPKHECGSSKWSGNFLNWATTTAIDEFILATTGGNRVIDTTSETVIRRARKHDNNDWFPIKALDSSYNVSPSKVTPFSDSTLFIYNTDFGVQFGTSRSEAKGSSPRYGPYNVQVKVCDQKQGIEANCVAYGGGTYFKPEGLIQKNANIRRFALTSYTFDTSPDRHGGVLRSNMKYVGPTRPKGGGGLEANPGAEWGTDGLLIDNPDGASGGLNSGVVNYINKFSDPGYKSKDPISELYYESLRYLKHLGPTPEFAANLPAGGEGGFQIVTNWDDPIQYACQQSFMIGINDANPWFDKRLPGTAFTSQYITDGYGNQRDLNDTGKYTPTDDWGTTSNPDPDINVKALTDKVGAMEEAAGGFDLSNFKVGGGDGTWTDKCTFKDVRSNGLGGVMGTCAQNSTGGATRDNTYYIAGLAYYANTTDLRPDFDGDQKVSTFMIDTQEYSDTPNVGPSNMLWLVGKYGGFIDENGNNQPDLPSEWDKDGDGEPDNYILATAPDKLINGLNKAFVDVDVRTSSAAAVALNSGALDTDTRLYQPRFNSGSWTGQLLAFDLDDVTGAVITPELWDAGDVLTKTAKGTGWSNARSIITYDGTQGVPFRWLNLTTTMQADLNKNGQGIPDVIGAEQGSKRLEYLRGSTANEGTGNNYRVRSSMLGDIVNSAPAFVGDPLFNYPDNLESSGETYSTFRGNNIGRTPMVYFGANDGMLHGIDTTNGKEVIAYVPKQVFPKLTALTAPNYRHEFYVDGSPTVGDAFDGSIWHTMLVGGLRQGGQAIYALDVTDPASFSEGNAASIAQWEFTDPDLGYSYSRPGIVRMNNGKWAAVFGNGYNSTENDGNYSTTGDAVLFVVDLFKGTVIAKIDTGVGLSDPASNGRPNGLATPAPIDADGDRTVDYIYAGDLYGNLWKFDVRNTDPTKWGSKRLFVAKDDKGAVQPITTQPEVGRQPTIRSGGAFNDGGYVVYFGTGKYLESSDNASTGTQTQTFYGIWDPDRASTPTIDRSVLLQQKILKEQAVTVNGVDASVRVTSDNAITWAPDPFNPGAGESLGWYMDLVNTDGGNTDPKGEKQITTPVLRDGRIIFTTQLPSGSTCDFGGDGWLMELDAANGSRLGAAPFDIDGDGVFDLVNDGNGNLVPPGGIKSTGGALSTPGILDRPDGTESKYMSGTDKGALQVVTEQGDKGGSASGEREAWRQLR
jgi:type IV pilus assembly protein PilY1